MENNLDITNPPFNEQIWQVPSDFVKSRFHCIRTTLVFSLDDTLKEQSIIRLIQNGQLLFPFLFEEDALRNKPSSIY